MTADRAQQDLCCRCSRPVDRGTVSKRVPVARIDSGSPEVHRILLREDHFGVLDRVSKSPRRPAGLVMPTFDARSVSHDGAKADRGKLLFEENDVDIPAGLHTENAYDLRLHAHASDPERAVLVVTTWMRFKFVHLLWLPAWTDEEMFEFARTFVQVIGATWSGRHELVDVTGIAQHRRISVEFDIVFDFGEESGGEHWFCFVFKTEGHRTSNVDRESHEAELDSNDFNWKFAQNPERQIGAAHEYGHMLGLCDEYETTTKIFARAWKGDVASIMNSGGEVRDRHYAPFADWVTRRFAELNADILTTHMQYKVNGTTDLSNASLERS